MPKTWRDNSRQVSRGQKSSLRPPTMPSFCFGESVRLSRSGRPEATHTQVINVTHVMELDSDGDDPCE